MESDSTTSSSDATLFTGEGWFDPIEAGLRGRVRGFIEDLIEHELAVALGRGRYERLGAETLPPGEPNQIAPPAAGHRHGHRLRRIMGSFGAVEIAVPRARMVTPEGVTAEWRSEALPRYARRTRQVEALIAGAYLAGTNTRRVRRALAALFAGAVSKDIVSRTWRKVKTDCHSSSAIALNVIPIATLLWRGGSVCLNSLAGSLSGSPAGDHAAARSGWGKYTSSGVRPPRLECGRPPL